MRTMITNNFHKMFQIPVDNDDFNNSSGVDNLNFMGT